MDMLGVWQGRIDSILVNIQIWIRELFNFQSDSSPLRDRAKKDIVLHNMIFTDAEGEGIAFGTVCLSVCLSVWLSVCLSAQKFHVFFLCNHLSD